jgi:hypothetical protein
VIEYRHGEAVSDVHTASPDGSTLSTATGGPMAWRALGTAELARQLAHGLDVHTAGFDVEAKLADLLLDYARYPPARRAAGRWQARPSGRLTAAVIHAHARRDIQGERCLEELQ